MRSLLTACSLLLLAGLLVGCSSDDGPDPSEAPRTNAAARTGGDAHRVTTPEEPTPAPDLTVETLDGRSIALAEQDGKVLLLNFWATWCPPCRKEIPDLAALQEELGPKGLIVIGISSDAEGAEVVRPFAEEHNINYPLVADPNRSLQDPFGPIYALPTTILIGPDGMVKKRILGIFPVDDMRSDLMAMLNGA